MRRGALLGAFALALGACGSPARTGERSDPATGALEQLFPAPKQGLALSADASLGALVDALTLATGWTVLADPPTRAALDDTPTGLDRAHAVSAREVHAFVEALLTQHGYAFAVVSARAPRILRVAPIQGPSGRYVLATPIQVEAAELDLWAREHPAIQLQTVLRTERFDTREPAASLRSMISDEHSQRIVIAGDGHALVLVGFAPWLAQMRETVAALDRAASPAEAAPSR